MRRFNKSYCNICAKHGIIYKNKAKWGVCVAKCCNCGIEIPDSDKTRLCDRCKKILLPFVKFMDASTSSAVRRLISNERNLRNAGVTDSGMDYLFKVCELHDQKKIQAQKEREAARQQTVQEVKQEEVPRQETYSETELPLDEPLDLIRKPYGAFLTAIEVVLVVAGIALIAWFVYALVSAKEVEIVSLVSAVVSFAAAYVADIARKLLADLSEIKKRFR